MTATQDVQRIAATQHITQLRQHNTELRKEPTGAGEQSGAAASKAQAPSGPMPVSDTQELLFNLQVGSLQARVQELQVGGWADGVGG